MFQMASFQMAALKTLEGDVNPSALAGVNTALARKRLRESVCECISQRPEAPPLRPLRMSGVIELGLTFIRTL